MTVAPPPATILVTLANVTIKVPLFCVCMHGHLHRWCGGWQGHSSRLLHPTAAQHSHATPVPQDPTHTPDQETSTCRRGGIHATAQCLKAAHEA